LEELLEGDPVLGCLASRDTDTIRLESLSNRRMAEDVVGIFWF
jgi:hypothetical protein